MCLFEPKNALAETGCVLTASTACLRPKHKSQKQNFNTTQRAHSTAFQVSGVFSRRLSSSSAPGKKCRDDPDNAVLANLEVRRSQ